MAKVKLGLAAAALLASTAATLPPPARDLPSNELVIATTAQLAPVLRKAAVQLERSRPGVHVEIQPVGSDVAMAQLFTHRADLAIIGRPAFDPELKAFQWIFQYPAKAWPVLQGSSSAPGHSPAIRVIVNAANPIRSISERQLQAAFRSQSSIRWRDLGVMGPFGMRTVHPMMPDTEQGTGRFIRQALFEDASLFAWKRVREFAEPIHREGADDRFAERLAAAVARDSQAIALTPAGAVVGTRIVPLQCAACDSRGEISRTVYAYADPSAGSDAKSFLRLLISGTEDGTIDAAPYRSLSASESRKLLKTLD